MTDETNDGSNVTQLDTRKQKLGPNDIPLNTPITRGEQKITLVTLRKPKSGELRGLTLTDLLQMDVGALHKVLPRISDPVLTELEVASLDPSDLLNCGSKVASFLL